MDMQKSPEMLFSWLKLHSSGLSGCGGTAVPTLEVRLAGERLFEDGAD